MEESEPAKACSHLEQKPAFATGYIIQIVANELVPSSFAIIFDYTISEITSVERILT